jgi:hypothetical protein
MLKRMLMMATVVSFCSLSSGLALAADPQPGQTGAQAQRQERVYGSQLMTPQERNEYQARMRAAKTAQERQQIRMEHHKAMQERARQQGVTLPDKPPAAGGGMGPGGRRGR